MKKGYIMHRVCTQCKKIFKIDFTWQFTGALVLYIMFFSAAFSDIRDDSDSLTTGLLITLILAIVFLGPAWYLTKDLFKREIDCKVCNGKRTLMMLGTPEALEVIKKYDLTISDDTPPQEKNKHPWQV